MNRIFLTQVFRPAINVGNSVSRVGGAAQVKAMKQVAGTLRIDLAQYRELAAFAQFGSDLDKDTQALLARGERLTEILKQGQYRPMEVENQVLIIWAATNGYVDGVAVSDLGRFESELFEFMSSSNPATMQNLRDKKKIDDDLTAESKEAVGDFVTKSLE